MRLLSQSKILEPLTFYLPARIESTPVDDLRRFPPPTMGLCTGNYLHLRPNRFARRQPLPLPTVLELMLAHHRYRRYQIMPEPMLSHCRCKCMHEQSLDHASFRTHEFSC